MSRHFLYWERQAIDHGPKSIDESGYILFFSKIG